MNMGYIRIHIFISEPYPLGSYSPRSAFGAACVDEVDELRDVDILVVEMHVDCAVRRPSICRKTYDCTLDSRLEILV